MNREAKAHTVTLETLDGKNFAIAATWLSDPALNQWLYFEWRNRKVDEKLLAIACASKKRHLWLIRARKVPYGLVGLTDINPVDKSAMLWILRGDKSLGGAGLMKEALSQAVRRCYDELGLHSLSCHIIAANKASRKLALSVGFREVGILRKSMWFRDRFVDCVIFDMLAEDTA